MPHSMEPHWPYSRSFQQAEEFQPDPVLMKQSFDKFPCSPSHKKLGCTLKAGKLLHDLADPSPPFGRTSFRSSKDPSAWYG